MIRLHMVVEGQTEETFVNMVLVEHLGQFNIVTDARCVETSRRRGQIYRGGVLDYRRVKKDLSLWMKEDQNEDAYFTTMLDVYALPEDSPGFADAQKQSDPYSRVATLEKAFADDIEHRRFIPHLQLHEFEALLFCDLSKFDARFNEHADKIQSLAAECSQFTSPELIDDGKNSAPSKRIIREIPEYEGAKASAGPLIAQKIGLLTMRQKCRHFNDWLDKLETLKR
ncbi:MAG: DUF4276 family protein [Candidatus Binatia bacterium]